ncbi:cysteinyl leukotriene receptor 2 [Epargyreus clarus]|uniref:cysteinyl leukotriene receptor 2 n=1 Tax=Epargyreus clarus TaxID=520877 RepID=UPI003C2E8B52
MAIQYGNFSLLDANFTTNVTNTTKYEIVVVQMASSMYVFLTPFLVMLGVLGNLLSVYVFYTSNLRLQSTSQYLSALALSDSLFLIQLLPPWFSTLELNGLFHQKGFCQAFVYISYVTCCFSAWLVIAFTIERFVAVQYPLQRNAVCTVTRARCVICALVAASLLVNIPVLLFAGSGDEECNIDREKLVHAATFNWVDTVVSFTIPLALIILLNTWIMIVVWKLERARMRLVKQEQRMPLPGQRDRATCHVGCPRSQQRVTRMLLVVSSVFVIFNLPAYTMRVVAYAYDMNAKELDDKWLWIQHISGILFNANFGINFFLYCLSGQNFRRALRQSVPCIAWVARTTRALRNATMRRRRANSLTMSATSNGTEATSNYGLSGETRNPQRHYPDSYILRFTFDNSRQRRQRGPAERASQDIEMRTINPRGGHLHRRNFHEGNL